MRIISRKGSRTDAAGCELEYSPNLDRLTFGGKDRQQLAATGLELGTAWRHLCVTLESVGGGKYQPRLYVDGSEVTTGLIAYSGNPTTMRINKLDALVPNDLPIGIGADPGGGNAFNGAIRDARIFSRALDADEVSGLSSETGLVGHWKLDETTGTTYIDSSGLGDDGSADGTVAPDDGLRAGSQRVVSASAIAGPDNASLAVGSEDFSIAYWFRPDATGVGTCSTLFRKLDVPSTTEIDFFYSDDNHLFFQAKSNGAVEAAVTAYNLSRGRWHHVVGVKTATEIPLYVNGALVATQAHTSTADLTNTAPIHLGRDKDDVGAS